MAWRADVLRVDYEISRIVDSERVNMGSVWRTICHGSHFVLAELLFYGLVMSPKFVEDFADSVDGAGKTTAPDRVVFFDGVCGMCNKTVNFLMARDSAEQLQFAPLQGQTAEQHVPMAIRKHLNTFVFLQSGKLHLRTSALIRILWVIGGMWGVLGSLLWLIPSPVRNLVYRFVARIRYRIYGKSESCRLPTAAERTRFLD